MQRRTYPALVRTVLGDTLCRRSRLLALGGLPMSEQRSQDLDEWSGGSEWRGLHELLSLMSKKWAVAVLLTLRPRPLRFAQLQREIGCGNVKTMTVTLRSLEEAGLVDRQVIDSRPPGVLYKMTGLGHTLIGSLDPVRKWSVDHEFDPSRLDT